MPITVGINFELFRKCRPKLNVCERPALHVHLAYRNDVYDMNATQKVQHEWIQKSAIFENFLIKGNLVSVL